MKRAFKAVCIASLLSAVAAPAYSGETYSVTPLQDLVPGYTGYSGLLNVPAAIGPTGTIVGNSYETTVDASTAVLWNAAGEISQLYAGVGATDINAKGQILISGGGILLYENGVLSPVNIDFGTGRLAWANLINDVGQIAGYGSFLVGSTYQTHAFLATNGVAVDLGTTPGALFSDVVGLNNHGDVVGDTYTTGVGSRAVLWRNGSLIELGVLPGQTSSTAVSVNDSGRVVGSSGGRLFTWENGVMTDLGNFVPGGFLGPKVINNNGDIAGTIYSNVQGSATASSFIWSHGVFTDIGPVVHNGVGCAVADMNDAGQIAMQCGEKAYRLSPTTPGVDLGLIVQPQTVSAYLGEPYTYTVEVTNVGSLTATNVTLSDVLPTSQRFVSVVPSQGSCSGTVSITCALGSLASSAKATVKVTVVITSTSGGFTPGASFSASVTSNEVDVNEPNNTADSTIYVVIPVADLSVKATATPSPAKRNANLTYTITVKNSGPTAAGGVTVTDTLPSSMSFVSAKATQGTCSGTSTVTCSLGAMSNGASTTVTIVVKPTQTGTFTNKATVSGNVQDNNTANNSVSISTTVK
jgi:uncharacterized repeat protein (TIGR01451 family)